MSSSKNLFSFMLSSEELLVALKYSKVDALPGFDIGDFAALHEDSLNTLLEIGERALIAHGILDIEYIADASELKIFLPAAFEQALQACSLDRPSLVLMTTARRGQAAAWIHRSQQGLVFHDIPLTGVHRFLSFDDTKTFHRFIDEKVIRFDQAGEIRCRPDRIRVSQFTAACSLDRATSKADIVRALTLGEARADTADLLADTLREFFALTSLSTPEVASTGPAWHKADMAFLQGKNGVWRLDADGKDWMKIEPCSVSDARMTLTKTLDLLASARP